MENWINDIRKRFERHQQEPPKGLLGDIKAEMQRRGLASTTSSAPRPTATFRKWWIAAACIGGLIAGTAVWWLRNSAPEMTAVIAHQQANHVGKQAAYKNKTVETQRQIVQQKLASWAVGLSGTRQSDRQKQEITAASATVQTPIQVQPSATNTDTTETKPRKRPIISSQQNDKVIAALEGNLVSFAPQRLSLSVYMGGKGLSNGVSNNGFHSVSFRQAMLNEDEKGKQIYSAPGYLPQQYHHRLPVKIGLSVGYQISRNWTIHTGLTYSYLSASISNANLSDGKDGLQRLHYVGIPLAASYRLWQYKRLHVYATAGGEVEKLVSGQLREPQTTMQETPKSETLRIKESRLQWSVNGAVGLQYQLTDRIGLYAEPGVSHYFNNGSDVENSYKHRPTGFQLQLGIRIK